MIKEVCIDVRMAFHGGIGTYIRNIISKLREGPFKIRLIANPSIVERWPLLRAFDVILTRASLYSVREQIEFPFLVPPCDLYWTPHYNIPLAPLRAKKRLTTIHDVYHLAFSKTLSLHKRLYANIVINGAAKISDHVITDSQFSKDEIIKYTHIPQEKISVILLGVDADLFTAKFTRDSLEKIREKYHLPQNYFLFVSTLAPHKNMERLLRAWSLLSREFPDWKVVFVGKPVKSYSCPIPNRENSIFLGEIDIQDLPALYQLAYAAIHPSLYEGFGLTPLEAMSCGCPAVVSTAASLPEVCGESAVYVDPYDVEDIARGMRKIIVDRELYTQLKSSSLDRSGLFRWDKTVEKHLEILDCLV